MVKDGQPNKLGEAISDRRLEKGLTQRALAEKLHIPHGDIGRLEAGFYAQPNPDLLARIARILEVEVEEFYDCVDYITPELPVYLRSRYGLPGAAAPEVEAYFRELQGKYGLPEGDL